ncbi:response regulator transcription factor [Streptomyces sp. WMMC500]|uniref:response regulator transcription factor n=1 Tax=Streptomyces sp. WMMC500 TaxID=3015154 RepID=UPI00248B53F6|nr:response regulator transcription factor [Streptomyces sp. WMMC500]WBB63804.1 response regulator transcription factor [Streptomyces sp. WMMC500]
MPARILVAEDDRRQADLIRRYLERDGHETTVVHDGRAALDRARRCSPDLLVLDLMLPTIGGLDVCRTLRSEQDVPIIMVTARASEDDLLQGLRTGADDYLTKPYRPRELLARIQAVLRRTARAAPAEPQQYRVGGLVVDTVRHQVEVDGVPVRTTPAEFTLLVCLAAAPGRAFTRELLLERVGAFDREVTGRTIDMHVLNLRRKIEPTPTRPRYLLTVYGIGYKLAEPPDGEAGDAP